MYTKIISKKGNAMYYLGEGKGKKLVSRKTIPEDELLKLGEILEEDESEEEAENPMDLVDPPETVDEEDEDESELEQAPSGAPVVELPKECIFCGFTSTRQKFINMIKVPLCEEHWSTKTTGEVAQEMREKGL